MFHKQNVYIILSTISINLNKSFQGQQNQTWTSSTAIPAIANYANESYILTNKMYIKVICYNTHNYIIVCSSLLKSSLHLTMQ